MKKEYIKALLNNYYEGSSSPGEEKILKDYFRNEVDVPAEFEADKAFFSSLEDSSVVSGEDRSEEIMNYIYNQTKATVRRRLLSEKLWVPIAAATVALIFSLWFGLNYLNKNDRSQDTFSDPEMAYLETQKALIMVSEKMNTGMQHMEELSAISTAAKGLEEFSQFGKTAGKLKNIDRKEESNKNE